MPIVKQAPFPYKVVEKEEQSDQFGEKTDYKNHRVVQCMNNKIHFERKGQFGFWTVHLDKGPMTAKLTNGQWTTFEAALRDVKNLYIEPNREKIKAIHS